jgi:sugar phosphate isomerase/epimerase
MDADRPVTLFTGQWNDLTLDEVAERAAAWGFDGLEIDCSGSHLDVLRALDHPAYLDGIRRTLDRHGLGVWALSNHVSGHAVANEPLDFRHEQLVLPRVWGDGDAEGVHRRAAAELQATARLARRLGVDRVVGFGGSSIWRYVVTFPGISADVVDAGFADFVTRWTPILDVFDEEGVVFALEPHPSEIAYDYWTVRRLLDEIARPTLGINWDPSHLMWQGVDPARFITDFADRIYHVDCKDTLLRRPDGRAGVLGSHLPWGDPRRAWDFVSAGRGDVAWEQCFRALDAIGYAGPVSIEWEDEGMRRERGASEAVAFVRAFQR